MLQHAQVLAIVRSAPVLIIHIKCLLTVHPLRVLLYIEVLLACLERCGCRSNRLAQLWNRLFSTTSAWLNEPYMTHLYWSFPANRIKSPDKLRLAMLYALRYEDTGNLRAVKSRLLESGLTPEKVDLIDALLQYSGMRRT